MAWPAPQSCGARGSAVTAGRRTAAARGDPPADEAAPRVGRDGHAADPDVRTRSIRSEANDNSAQANYRKAVRLTARIASLVATYGRMKNGGGPIDPDPALGHAANFLYMLTGNRPTALSTRAFDIALVLHADHELNASTFAASVAAATLTDLYSAIVGAIGTLKGPLHGGANADVMRLLIEIGPEATPERIDEAIRGKLARKVKIPGLAIAFIGRRIRARRTCGACRKSSARKRATPDGSRCLDASRRS